MGGNGRANRPGPTLVVSRVTRVQNFGPLVFLHEFGHNFSLCHLEGGTEPSFVSSTCNADGTVPPSDESDEPVGSVSKCRHYCGVPSDDHTAMGDTVGGAVIIGTAVGFGTIGAGIGFAISGGNPLGAGIGFGVGALVGLGVGFFNSDAGQRTFDYHPLEWQMIRSGSPSSTRPEVSSIPRSGLQLVKHRRITLAGDPPLVQFGEGAPVCDGSP